MNLRFGLHVGHGHRSGTIIPIRRHEQLGADQRNSRGINQSLRVLTLSAAFPARILGNARWGHKPKFTVHSVGRGSTFDSGHRIRMRARRHYC
jgi:hypothetical protein